MEVAQCLLNYTREKRPDLYEAILFKIQPHSLESVLRILERHLLKVPDLNLFNEHIDAVPEFVWTVVRFLKFPTPGDAYGIHRACRITKSDTQCALDSKHLSSSSSSGGGGGGGVGPASRFNVEKDVLHELDLFSTQKQVFEFSNRRRYATVYVRGGCVEKLTRVLPDACRLVRGGPRNKGVHPNGTFKYLSDFKYILVEDKGSVKVLYQSLKDLYKMLCKVPLQDVIAFSDVRCLFQKCGIVSHFFNMVRLVNRQLFDSDDDNDEESAYEKDVLTLVKYQCRSGKPLPLTRDGLAKNPDRTPLEILSFEAPKKNFARLVTGPSKDKWFDVETSVDKIFFGQQFNEGTGYHFSLRPGTMESET